RDCSSFKNDVSPYPAARQFRAPAMHPGPSPAPFRHALMRAQRTGRACLDGEQAGRSRGDDMPKFTIVTPKGASFTVAGGGYGYELEALDPIGAEIVEAPANEAEFIQAARSADAIYAKGLPISKKIIDSLENCKVITLGTVGVD